MTNLSPAAQAVMDAALEYSGPAFEPLVRKMVTDVLRTAVDQVIPEVTLLGSDYQEIALQEARKEILAIAAELEGQGG